MIRSPLRLLLGPQRPEIHLGDNLVGKTLGDAPTAVISAGWQEAEGDLDELRPHVANALTDLRLYERAEALFAADESLRDAYRRRQDTLQDQQQLYRLRLKQLSIATREILRIPGDVSTLAEERRHAISQLRALDSHHVRQVRKINAEFEDRFCPEHHAAIADVANAIGDELSKCGALLVTGGNVVVLINRLRLFGMEKYLRRCNIVAWSAGAMVLCDRIVLFHDRMPQGRRDPEIMCEGLGIIGGTVLLPDVRNRLRTNELVRTSLFSRRFSPATCLALDNGSSLLLVGGKVDESVGVRHLSREGKLRSVRTA